MPYYRCAPCGLKSYSEAATASVCPNCSATLGEGEKLYARSGADHAITRVLAARPEAVAEARQEVVGLPLPELTRGKLALLVSELMSNAVLHTSLFSDSPVRLKITIHAGRVRLAVHDLGQGFALESLKDADSLAAGGRGLVIVARLSEDWGVDLDPDGCTVWCEVRVDEEPSTAIDRQVTRAYLRELAVEMGRPAAAVSV